MRKRIKSPRTRITEARRVANRAIDAAAQEAALPGSRSTRTRTAYKIKAEALDRVARILAGKE